jgi:hypothetical protein
VWELHGAADHDAAFSIMLGSGFLFAVISIAIVAVSTMEKYSDKIGGGAKHLTEALVTTSPFLPKLLTATLCLAPGADRSNRHMHDSDDSD